MNDDLMLIHTQGLDEGIRCAMCKNHNANDRGCDGGCVVDDEMYKKVMGVIDKTLEAQPCEDSVSRETVKAFLYERLDRLNDNELYDIFSKIIDDFYNELPSVTPKSEWIPCSERLPEEHKEVLTCDLGGYIEIQSFEDSYDGYWENRNGDWSDLNEIIAWMSLPEPYKAESEVLEYGSD